jgi:4-oxalocrotonate tautomerase
VIAAATAPGAVDRVLRLLNRYFDGLHHSDAEALTEVLHPQAIYATSADGTLTRWSMDEYLPVLARRPSPASREEVRTDAIESIEFAGPHVALARVRCSVADRDFTDLLSLVEFDDRWWVIAKVFSYDIREG